MRFRERTRLVRAAADGKVNYSKPTSFPGEKGTGATGFSGGSSMVMTGVHEY